MSVLRELLIKINVSVDGAKKASEDVDGATKSAEDTDKKGSPKLKAFAAGAKLAFGAVAVAAAAASGAILAAGGAVYKFVEGQTASLDKIAKHRKQTGLAADEHQRLAFAAERSGSNIDTVGKAARKMNVQLQDVAQGGGKAFTDTLASIGLSVEDLEGKSAEERLGIIGDAMNRVADDAEKTAIAARLLGEEAGPGLVPLLNEGTEGIRKLGDAAGDIFTEEELAQAEAFQDAITDVKRLLGQVAGELALAVEPAVRAGVDVFREFVAANQELIKVQLPKILTTVAENATKLLPVVLKVAGAVADVVSEAAPLVDRFAVFISGKLEKGLGGTKSAIQLLLPVVIKLADAVLDVVDGIERAYRWAVELGSIEKNQALTRGGVGFLGDQKDPATGESPNERKAREARERERAREQAQQSRDKEERREESRLRRQNIKALADATKGGRRWTARDQAAAADAGITREQVAAFAGVTLSKGGGGRGRGGKPATEPGKAAHFGDFRDVLAVYMGRGPEEAVQALSTLEKGTMPADHRPETSINITNNINYDVAIEVNGAGSPEAVAQAIDRHWKNKMKGAAIQVPQNLAR